MTALSRQFRETITISLSFLSNSNLFLFAFQGIQPDSNLDDNSSGVEDERFMKAMKVVAEVLALLLSFRQPIPISPCSCSPSSSSTPLSLLTLLLTITLSTVIFILRLDIYVRDLHLSIISTRGDAITLPVAVHFCRNNLQYLILATVGEKIVYYIDRMLLTR